MIFVKLCNKKVEKVIIYGKKIVLLHTVIILLKGKKMNIHDYDFEGKKAIVRVDFNVPLDENGKITDNTVFVVLCQHLSIYLITAVR